jgi:hypothetical protein
MSVSNQSAFQNSTSTHQAVATKQQAARFRTLTKPSQLLPKLIFSPVSANKSLSVSSVCFKPIQKKKSRTQSDRLRALLKDLGLARLCAPLKEIGIYTTKDLRCLESHTLDQQYELHLSKLLAFKRSSFWHLYQSASNRQKVVLAFEKAIYHNFRRSLTYIEREQVMNSPMKAFTQRHLSPVTPSFLPQIKQSKNRAARGLCPSHCRPVTVKKIPPPHYQKKIAVIFGINTYREWPQLINAVNDATAMTEKFAELGFQVMTYTNEEVTKEKVAKVFKKEIPSFCSPHDLLVVAFHGHGHTMHFNNKQYGYLVPFDCPFSTTPYDLVSMEEISIWLKYIPARHVLLLLDSCFSGLMAMRGAKIKSAIPPSQKPQCQSNEEARVRYQLSKKARIVINAGHEDQVVSDGGWQGHSVFTGSILASPVLRDPLSSVYQLFQSIYSTVTKITGSAQVPTMGKLVGDGGGDLFVAL